MSSSTDNPGVVRHVVEQAPDGAVFANRKGKAVTSGHTKYGGRALKTRATHKDGHKLYVSLAFSSVKNREGRAVAAMATAREFTEDRAQ